MFICLNCQNLFEEPLLWYEPHGERYAGCPFCKSGDFTETWRCDDCGLYITDEYIELNSGKKYCPNCTYKNKLKYL